MVHSVTKISLTIIVLPVFVAAWGLGQTVLTDAPAMFDVPSNALAIRPLELVDDHSLPTSLSPGIAAGSSLSGKDNSDASDPASQEMFWQLMRDYGSEGTEQEDKILIEQSLRELNASALGRSFIVDTFFSTEDPELAASIYNLMLDADLKDVALIGELIRRDRTESAEETKMRIIDLIADLATQEETPYSPEIEAYLDAMSADTDPRVQSAAKSQHAWYLAKHQPDNTAALRDYLLDGSSDVRSEMYDLVTARISDTPSGEHVELTLTLQSLLHADYLDIAADEKTQIAGLIQSLGGTIQ